jgi:hypothetical protein
MKSLPNTRTSNKNCLFHKDKGHNTKECYALKNKIERLIIKGYLHQFLKKDSHSKPKRKVLSQSMIALPEMNMILGGTSMEGDSSTRKRKYRKEVLTTTRLQNQWHGPIIFTLEDGEGITFPYEMTCSSLQSFLTIEYIECWWIMAMQSISSPTK